MFIDAYEEYTCVCLCVCVNIYTCAFHIQRIHNDIGGYKRFIVLSYGLNCKSA